MQPLKIVAGIALCLVLACQTAAKTKHDGALGRPDGQGVDPEWKGSGKAMLDRVVTVINGQRRDSGNLVAALKDCGLSNEGGVTSFSAHFVEDEAKLRPGSLEFAATASAILAPGGELIFTADNFDSRGWGYAPSHYAQFIYDVDSTFYTNEDLVDGERCVFRRIDDANAIVLAVDCRLRS